MVNDNVDDSIPSTHCKVQGFGDRLVQDGGQALPHSKKIFPSGHVGGSTGQSSGHPVLRLNT